MAETVHIREVGPRDGLQMVKQILSTDRKLEWCRRAVEAGIAEVEVTSFVPPKVLPQYADAVEVALGALEIPGLRAAALVPNLKGAQRAFDVGLRKVNYVVSASDAHSRANVQKSTDEAIEEFGLIVAERAARGARVELGVGIATAFGCTIAGAVAESHVVDIAERLLSLGADEIVIADTVGYGNPAAVKRILPQVMRLSRTATFGCHFHDTRGLGLANVTAAAEVGIRAFDASLAGLGGCPFAPGASGNVNLEDTVYLLESLGFSTGIDFAKLLALRKEIESWLAGEAFTGSIAKAGLPKNFRQLPA